MNQNGRSEIEVMDNRIDGLEEKLKKIEDLQERVAILESKNPVASRPNYKSCWETLKRKMENPNNGKILYVGRRSRNSLLDQMSLIETLLNQGGDQ